ncbi:MAG TPA: hypothetical protein VFQ32_13650 [Ktedonobacterales bacterium]|nr:hypothetical protein [Ktedonobacterales bacterium]
MSETVSSFNQAGSVGAAPTAGAMEEAQSVSTEIRRPGLVTFAAIMMFVNGGFSLVWAIQEFSSASWIRANLDGFGYSNLSSYLWAWGILDLILAGIAIYAGIDILRGRAFGLIVGLVIAGVSATRWFFYLPAASWTAVVIIAVDVLVIYGLVSGAEFFERTKLHGGS